MRKTIGRKAIILATMFLNMGCHQLAKSGVTVPGSPSGRWMAMAIPLETGEAVSGAVGRDSPEALFYKFNGEKGDVVSFEIQTAVNGCEAKFSILDPEGAFLETFEMRKMDVANVGMFQAPFGGEYILKVEEQYNCGKQIYSFSMDKKAQAIVGITEKKTVPLSGLKLDLAIPIESKEEIFGFVGRGSPKALFYNITADKSTAVTFTIDTKVDGCVPRFSIFDTSGTLLENFELQSQDVANIEEFNAPYKGEYILKVYAQRNCRKSKFAFHMDKELQKLVDEDASDEMPKMDEEMVLIEEEASKSEKTQ